MLVKLHGLGDLNKETLIRAEIAGTAVSRGDRDAELDFAVAPGRRFVYVADCEMDVLSVRVADTLTNLAPAADPAAEATDLPQEEVKMCGDKCAWGERDRVSVGSVQRFKTLIRKREWGLSFWAHHLNRETRSLETVLDSVPLQLDILNTVQDLIGAEEQLAITDCR